MSEKREAHTHPRLLLVSLNFLTFFLLSSVYFLVGNKSFNLFHYFYYTNDIDKEKIQTQNLRYLHFNYLNDKLLISSVKRMRCCHFKHLSPTLTAHFLINLYLFVLFRTLPTPFGSCPISSSFPSAVLFTC